MVAVAEIALGDRARAARAFGDVLAGHLQMDAARIRAFRLMNGEERADFAHHALEGARLVAACGYCVAVHGIARPHDRAPGALHGANERGQMIDDFVGAKAADQRQAPGLVVGIERIYQAQQIVGLQRGAALEADGVFHATAIFNVRMIELARAVADPDHMAGGGVMISGGGIDARQRLLEAQQQRLVRGVEIGCAHFLMALGVETDGAHEGQRFGDAVGQFLIAVGLRRILHKAQHPAMGVLKVGVAAGGERAQQVQRRCRLAISLQQATRIGRAGRFRKFKIVDDVAAIYRQLDVAALFGVGRTGLGELPRDAPDLHNRRRARERQHHGHLQEHAEEIADVVGGMLGKALGAIAALQQERFAQRHVAKRALELARLARKHQRRIACKRALNLVQSRLVRIKRRLLDGLASPAIDAPAIRRHVSTPNGRIWRAQIPRGAYTRPWPRWR